MITLYGMPLSGNCHKVRLLLSLLALPYQIQAVDLRAASSAVWTICNATRSAKCLCWMTTALSSATARPFWCTWANAMAATMVAGRCLSTRTNRRWLSTAANEIFHGPANCAYTTNSGVLLIR